VAAEAQLDPDEVTFRPLTEADLPQLYAWLHQPHVARWWYEAEPITPAWVAEHYGKHIPFAQISRPFSRSDDTTREAVWAYTIVYAGTPIGYIQTYRIDHDADYAAAVAVDEVAAGVDLYIGEPAFAYQGLGAPLLRVFLRDYVFADPAIESCIIGPEPANTGAIRAYEKAGFRFLKQIQVPDEPQPEYLMQLTRVEFMAAAWH
jgi:RimJ/RimL family protein N-acetyltransferase